jgi:hypothetical protein
VYMFMNESLSKNPRKLIRRMIFSRWCNCRTVFYAFVWDRIEWAKYVHIHLRQIGPLLSSTASLQKCLDCFTPDLKVDYLTSCVFGLARTFTSYKSLQQSRSLSLGVHVTNISTMNQFLKASSDWTYHSTLEWKPNEHKLWNNISL